MKFIPQIAAILALFVLVGGWWYLKSEKYGLAEKNTELQVRQAPEILPADLADQKWAPEKLSFQEKPEVTTRDGNKITLQILDGYAPNAIFYRFENNLYLYTKPEYQLNREAGVYVSTTGLGTFELIPNGDPNTYEVIQIGLSFEFLTKDKNNVYCMGKILQDADAATFKRISTWPDFKKTEDNKNLIVAEDANHQYLSNCTIYK